MRTIFTSLLIFACLSVFAQTSELHKNDTICILKIQSQILNSRKTLDKDAVDKYVPIILNKTKIMVQHKYTAIIDTNNFEIAPSDYQLFMQIVNEKKQVDSNVINILKHYFSKNKHRFQLLVIQNASYDPNSRYQNKFTPFGQSETMRIYSGLNQNELSFFLFDTIKNKFRFLSQTSSKTDPRDKEQTERQILKALKEVYYGL